LHKHSFQDLSVKRHSEFKGKCAKVARVRIYLAGG
jgi:hypothetical protein